MNKRVIQYYVPYTYRAGCRRRVVPRECRRDEVVLEVANFGGSHELPCRYDVDPATETQSSFLATRFILRTNGCRCKHSRSFSFSVTFLWTVVSRVMVANHLPIRLHPGFWRRRPDPARFFVFADSLVSKVSIVRLYSYPLDYVEPPTA